VADVFVDRTIHTEREEAAVGDMDDPYWLGIEKVGWHL
jgi:hypothetical protein